MHILHITPSLEKTRSRYSATVAGMSSSLARAGARVTVATTVAPGQPVEPFRHIDTAVQVKVFERDMAASLWPGHSAKLARFIQQSAGRFDVVHAHGLWHHPMVAAARAARDTSTPLVVSLHGALAPGRQPGDSVRRLLYTRLVQRPLLAHADLVHVMSHAEEAQARSYGIHGRVDVIPLGLEMEPLADQPDTSDAIPNGPFNLLFLGKVDEDAGLELVIDALSKLERNGVNVRLVIAGPYDPNYRISLEVRARNVRVADRVEFVGVPPEEGRRPLFMHADAFVMASQSAGLTPEAIEALAHGVPLILSHEAEVPEVKAAGAGLAVTLNAVSIAGAVFALTRDRRQVAAMGRAGRTLAEQRYSWAAMAPKYVDAYRSVTENAAFYQYMAA